MIHNSQPSPLLNQPQPNVVSVSRRRYPFIRFVFTMSLLIGIMALWINRQYVIDQITVWVFKPTAEVSSFVGRAGLNQTGAFYLYASQAEVDDRSAFNNACGNLLNEKTVVLGCYTGLGRRIYIYRVTDAQLDGVEDVTAAHEMLHAAYDRLSDSDRTKVDALLVAQEKTITDQRILDLIKDYQQSEPTQVVNELHSIFGTEVRNLSPELEAYYSRYFSNRLATVSLKEKYEAVFTNLAAKQKQLIDSMNSIAADVANRQAAYTAALATLNADVAAFNAWARSGQATQTEFNTRRAALEARVAALDAERTAINAEIDTYNALKAQLDSLNIQAETLNQHIDSKLSPAPTL